MHYVSSKKNPLCFRGLGQKTIKLGLKGIGPEDIGVDKLVNRVLSEDVREVVLATSYTAEGEMTAHMIASVLKKKAPAVRVTRLSKGLSTGVEVEYTDPATLTAAILGRH